MEKLRVLRPLPQKGSQLGDIREFHTKFNQSYEGPPRFLTQEEMRFRLKFLREEVQELEDAITAGNLPDALDALVDLDFVQKGTVYLMGFERVYRTAWTRVQDANMVKELAGTPERSKRGYAGDIIKPPGWTAPDHSDLCE